MMMHRVGIDRAKKEAREIGFPILGVTRSNGCKMTLYTGHGIPLRATRMEERNPDDITFIRPE